MGTAWSRGSRPTTTHKRAVGMQKMTDHDDVWTPCLRAGSSAIRYQPSGFEDVYVPKPGATTGKRLFQVNGVPALILKDDD